MEMMDEVAAAKLEANKQDIMDDLIASDKCLFADGEYRPPVRFNVRRPKDENGVERDQTPDQAANMRDAAKRGLVQLPFTNPHGGTAIIVGGAPSIKDQLELITELSQKPDHAVFALNW